MMKRLLTIGALAVAGFAGAGCTPATIQIGTAIHAVQAFHQPSGVRRCPHQLHPTNPCAKVTLPKRNVGH